MDTNQSQQNRKRKLYSTKIIEQLLLDRASGYDIDYEPFFNRDTDLRASNIPFIMTTEEMNEYQKCYDEPEYFINTYCKFMTDKGLDTVELRDYQKKVIDVVTQETYSEELQEFIPLNRSIVWLASRQIGKTTTVSSFLAWMIVFHIDRNILIVANKEKTAIEIVDKIINVFKGLPFFLKPGCDNFGKTGLKLDNGSKIISSATTNTASIGFTIHCVLLDEFAHIPDNIVSSFWRSVYPTLSSSKVSQCIITSTPNGTTNKFYEIVDGAINKRNSFYYLRTDYWEVPGHDDEWAKMMRADFGEEDFAQEFELQFNKSSKMIMKSNDMSFFRRICKEYKHKDVYINNTILDTKNLVWDESFNPNDINPNDKFIFIVDIAEGNGDPEEKHKEDEKTPDSNTINIFRLRLTSPSNLKKYSDNSCSVKDCVRFQQVGYYCCDEEDEVYTAKVCAALAYNLFRDHERDNVRIMLEMNFNGKAFFEEFKRHPYYMSSTILRTYHTKPIPGEKLKKKYGFKTTRNKEYYCLKGNKIISQRRIIITSEKTLNQMVAFGFVRGKLKGIGVHDDLSMPVFNHISRMLDETSFISWIEEWIMFYADKNSVFKLNEILQKWALDNPNMSDDEFSGLYGIDNKPHIEGYPASVYDGNYNNIIRARSYNPYE